mmetsp:Transcript_15614/g.47435  ORF Transcript_15614/g.47435 Transcript_15614/m.47435 type:complete len:127 (+) Transcript_15614:594-974(+)
MRMQHSLPLLVGSHTGIALFRIAQSVVPGRNRSVQAGSASASTSHAALGFVRASSRRSWCWSSKGTEHVLVARRRGLQAATRLWRDLCVMPPLILPPDCIALICKDGPHPCSHHAAAIGLIFFSRL